MRRIMMFSAALPALLMAAEKGSGSGSAKTAAEKAAAQKDAQTADLATQRSTQTGDVAGQRAAQTGEDRPLPESSAVADPAPASTMESPSGAFIEDEIKEAIPTEHPAVDNNPRAGTSAVQNGQDFNDPERRKPSDEGFVGQGLDPNAYGKAGG